MTPIPRRYSKIRCGRIPLYFVVNMKGERAVAVYAVFRSTVPKEAVRSFMETAEARLDSAALMIKPINQDAFALAGSTAKQEIQSAWNGMDRLCPSLNVRKFPLSAPNLLLNPPPSLVTDEQMRATYGLTPRGREPFPIEKTVKL